MSLFEYEARMYAFRLSEVDREHDMHLQAWLANQASATKESGKSVFKSFKDFFDYEKQVKEIERGVNAKEIKPQHKRMAKLAAEANARGG